MTDLEQVAFENPDGRKVLVITNPGPARNTTLKQGDQTAEIALAPESVTTLLWS